MKSLLFLFTIILCLVQTIAQETGLCWDTCQQGTCMLDECVCDDDGWFGMNCDIKASLLNPDEVVSMDIPLGDWGYFYFPLEGKNSSSLGIMKIGVTQEFRLFIEAEYSFLKIYTLLQVENSYILPGSSNNNQSYNFFAGSNTGTIRFTEEMIQSVGQNGKLIVGFQNSPLWTTNVSVLLRFNGTGSFDFPLFIR